MQRRVHHALMVYGPLDEKELHVRIVGETTSRGISSGISSAIDTLARHGVVIDSGERAGWHRGRRLIVWRAVADGRL